MLLQIHAYSLLEWGKRFPWPPFLPLHLALISSVIRCVTHLQEFIYLQNCSFSLLIFSIIFNLRISKKSHWLCSECTFCSKCTRTGMGDLNNGRRHFFVDATRETHTVVLYTFLFRCCVLLYYVFIKPTYSAGASNISCSNACIKVVL